MGVCFKSLAAALVVAAVSPVLHAQDDLYGGLNVVQVSFEATGLSTLNPTALQLTLGKQFNPYFAAEVRGGVGIADDSTNVKAYYYSGYYRYTYNVDVSMGVDSYVGLYGKAMLPLDNGVSLYGMLGVTNGKMKATAKQSGYSFSISDSATSASYGVGADFFITKELGLNVEYAHLWDDTGYDVNALSAGLKYKF